MLATVPPAGRARLALLFEGFPGLRGAVDAVLDGAMGEAWADDLVSPSVARLRLDFELLAGDPSHPAAAAAVRSLREGAHVVAPESWTDVVTGSWAAVQPYERTEFSAGTWDLAALRARQALPDGFSLVRVDTRTVGAFAQLDPAFVYNFRSHEDFLARGAGFGVLTPAGEFVAGCSSYAVSSRSLEFEIETDEAYQRRGLAVVTGSRMLEHCLETGLVPCWDAAHEGSARLALKLGFVNPRPYTAYHLEQASR